MQQRHYSTLVKLLCAGTFALAHTTFLHVSKAIAVPAYFNDPANYPAAWPDGQWKTYKINGGALRDDSGDNTDGGSQPTGSADISPCNGQTASTYYYRDTNNLYFRICLADDPYSGGNPYSASVNWSILIDVTGDGFRDFVVMLDGKDGTSPNNLFVLYKNDLQQGFDKSDFTSSTSLRWKQDSAKGTNNPVNTTEDNETSWDVTNSSLATKDFKRTRIVSNGDGTYFLDIQVPLSALDSGTGVAITPTSSFAIAFATANSNTNPLQKDFTAAGNFKVEATKPIPFGDVVGSNNETSDQPNITSVSASGTCSATELSAIVQDSIKVSGTGNAATFGSSIGEVKFYYQYDTDNNNLPDLNGGWTLIGSGTIDSTNISKWKYTWNTNVSTLLKGKYFIKAIAKDMGADGNFSTATDNNTTDSIDTVDNAGNNSSGGDTYNVATNGTTAIYDSTINSSCPNAATGVTVSGKVFEDINYGGGAGRNHTTANTAASSSFGGIGSGSSTAAESTVVELYTADTSGNFTKSQQVTTNSTGDYSFTSVMGGSYRIRVVNNTVRSKRSGYTYGTHLPVQTYRKDPDATTSEITNEVGGRNPANADGGTEATNASFPTNAQSWTDIGVGTTTNITGADFGFNFDTIVNTNDSGQGSLRQFITNSNALANTNLDQAANSIFDPAAGDETSIFMIPAAQLISGVAKINITSASLPAITDNTAIDGRTQTANIGNTNAGLLGTGGTVGVDGLTLNQLNGPEIEIKGTNSIAGVSSTGLNIQANNIRVQGIAIYGFSATETSEANIKIGSSTSNPSNPLITENAIGTTATSFSDLGADIRTGSYGIYTASSSGTFSNNLVGYNGRGGIEVINSSTSITAQIIGNEIRGNAILDSRAEGTNMGDGGGIQVIGNLFADQGGPGIDMATSPGGNTYRNNTVANNGLNLTGQSNPQTSGIRVLGSGNTIDRNIIKNNAGAGILVRSNLANPAITTTNNLITKNSIFGNGQVSGQIGIDLVPSGGDGDTGGTGNFVTINDGGTTTSAGNSLLDFPVLREAFVTGSSGTGFNLVVTGYSRPNAIIELFIADPDPSGFGEGKTYLVTKTEGIDDSDNTTGSYNYSSIGADSNANKFKFTIPMSQVPGVGRNTKLTATTTIGNNTSEFSNNITVATSNVLLVKRITAINGNRINNPNQTSIALNTFVDDTTTTHDNHAAWPTNPNPYLVGQTNAGKVRPGDEIEYTIYFLNAGNLDAKDVRICDRLLPNQTFKPDTYATGKGTELKLGASTSIYLTNADDTNDRTKFIPASGAVPANCNLKGTNADGTLLVDVTGNSGTGIPTLISLPGTTGAGAPNDSYGFIRFVTKVK
jgi:uncharacterized repeat protein (TIGR01451 family)